MIKDDVKVVGKLHIQLFDADGNLKQEYHESNLVVNAGLNFITNRMKDVSVAVMSHMAIGSGSTAPAGGDTELGTELGRVALTSTTVTANTIEYVGQFPNGTGTGAVTEAGIFNAGTAGTMLCRSTFGVVTKSATDSMQITWTITVS